MSKSLLSVELMFARVVAVCLWPASRLRMLSCWVEKLALMMEMSLDVSLKLFSKVSTVSVKLARAAVEMKFSRESSGRWMLLLVVEVMR